MKRTLPLFAFLFLGAFALGSSISCDSIDEAFDCSQVCGRYRDCYDSSYDVDACESRCRTSAANDPNVKAAADTCVHCNMCESDCPAGVDVSALMLDVKAGYVQGPLSTACDAHA